jgi:hypothetical protein
MKHESNFNSDRREEHQAQTGHEHTQQKGGIEFANVEEMFRHDALHTPVPPAVEVRLQKSIEKLPNAPALPWWKRILGA